MNRKQLQKLLSKDGLAREMKNSTSIFSGRNYYRMTESEIVAELMKMYLKLTEV